MMDRAIGKTMRLACFSVRLMRIVDDAASDRSHVRITILDDDVDVAFIGGGVVGATLLARCVCYTIQLLV